MSENHGTTSTTEHEDVGTRTAEERSYGPCPSWCTEADKRQHRDDDAWRHPDDRVHYSEYMGEIDPLEVMRPRPWDRPGGGFEWLENDLRIYLAQRWRESGPRMVFMMNDSTMLELTIPEARLVFLGISNLLNAAEGGGTR